ncbi:hypothetical protein IQ265_14130 [Nodosilinea sp. LEGE 06152]|uniref:hypothetical protein n=1 Tax=Nodosilinea sp. LEGE 06152 TaxID=2777966 RepID=UPI0018806573|nr:hypothetical protein [Nodosilinea sp. LEGE 06152]MBE9157956.1 hypothetical protein [Nodosilinea sp. LEGE 06152]
MTKLVKPVIDSAWLLRWWHRHQAQWLNREADAIRNGLLQDLFAVRRQLELLPSGGGLATVEHLYEALADLGNRLSSPYLHDSLPLAIQQALADWPPQVPARAELPGQWSVEPVEHTLLLLAVLNHLGQALAAQPNQPQLCVVSLAEGPDRKRLTVSVDYAIAVPPALLDLDQSEAWMAYLTTFDLFSQGQASSTYEATTLRWTFDW